MNAEKDFRLLCQQRRLPCWIVSIIDNKLLIIVTA